MTRTVLLATVLLFASASLEAEPRWYKVHPRPGGFTLRSLSCRPGECVMVGDGSTVIASRPGTGGAMMPLDIFAADYRFERIIQARNGYAILGRFGNDAESVWFDVFTGTPDRATSFGRVEESRSANKVRLVDPNLPEASRNSPAFAPFWRDGLWTGAAHVLVGAITEPAGASRASRPVSLRAGSIEDSDTWEFHYVGDAAIDTVDLGYRAVAMDDAGGLVAVGGGAMLLREEGTTRLYTDSRPVAVLGRSDDGGRSWTPVVLPCEPGDFDRPLNDVAWDGVARRFAAVGERGTLVESADGRNWTRVRTNVRGDFFAVASNGRGRFVAVGNRAVWVADRKAAVDTEASWAPAAGAFGKLLDVAWDGYQFVAVGEFGVILASNDGVQWTRWDNGANRWGAYAGIADSGEALVAVGAHGVLDVSRDGGRTWRHRAFPDTYDAAHDMHAVTWTGRQFVAVGNRGLRYVCDSADGDSWEKVEDAWTGTDFRERPWPLYDVDGIADPRGGSTIIAVGLGGLILSSRDGRVWEAVEPGPTVATLTGIAHDDAGNFVAVGGNTILYGAPDGRAWAVAPRPDFVDLGTWMSWLSDVTWDVRNRQFVVVGCQRVLTSPDGYQWTDQSGDGIWGNLCLDKVASDRHGVVATAGQSLARSPAAKAGTWEGHRPADPLGAYAWETLLHSWGEFHREGVFGILGGDEAVAVGGNHAVLLRREDVAAPMVVLPEGEVAPGVPGRVLIAEDGNAISRDDSRVWSYISRVYARDDLDGVILDVKNDLPVGLPVGTTTTVVFTATDMAGNAGTAIASIRVDATQAESSARVFGGSRDGWASAAQGRSRLGVATVNEGLGHR